MGRARPVGVSPLHLLGMRGLLELKVAVGQDEPMALMWEQVTVDAADPVALGRWWAGALDWVIVNDDPEEFEIRSARRNSYPGSYSPVSRNRRR